MGSAAAASCRVASPLLEFACSLVPAFSRTDGCGELLALAEFKAPSEEAEAVKVSGVGLKVDAAGGVEVGADAGQACLHGASAVVAVGVFMVDGAASVAAPSREVVFVLVKLPVDGCETVGWWVGDDSAAAPAGRLTGARGGAEATLAAAPKVPEPRSRNSRCVSSA